MKEMTERRSIRKYKALEVNKGEIIDIIKAGALAPSAKNRQPWKYIVYSGKEKESIVLPIDKNGKPDWEELSETIEVEE